MASGVCDHNGSVKMRLACLAAALLGAAGCMEDEAFLPETTSAPIIGGIEDDGSPAVVMTTTSTGSCTGTLVAPRIVLTAGHCVINSIKAGNHGGRVYFGHGGSEGFDTSVRVSRLAAHRFYETFQFYDIAMMRLQDPAPPEIEPMAFQLDPIPNDMIGETVRVVGFGVSDGVAQTGFGVKRTLFTQITSMAKHHIGYGDSGSNICQGDSGGPTFMDNFPDGEIVIAVSSYGANNCMAESQVARTDAYPDWLIEVYDAWSGPCQHDGVCVTDGCRTPDPDCDTCGFDGVCGSQCPRPDLDCELGEFAGDLCNTDFDCEYRRCVPALDDPRIKYCSATCDPEGPVLDECTAPLSVCSNASTDDHVCHYNGPSPGAQGHDCTDGSDCRSGACDGEFDICVEQCGDGLPECPGEYSCEKRGGASVCTFPSGGGCGCRAGGRGGRSGGGIAMLLVAAVWVASQRRRRRHSA